MAWATCFAARRTMVAQLLLTNRLARPTSQIRKCCRHAELGAGEMYDMLQKRDLALAKYQAVIANDASTAPAETARKLMKDAYRE